MRKLLLTFGSYLCTLSLVFGGWTNYSSTFEGESRTYKIYTPSSVQTDAKVVVLLHGLGATMNDFDFSSWPSIADSANIVLISPQGLPYSSLLGVIEGVFNSGMNFMGMGVNETINDVGFVSALLDTVIAKYSIDQNRIYATGFSNGGFMVQRLASDLTARFSAVASVSGTRSATLPALAVGTKLPVAHFHGTTDSVVTWTGDVNLNPTLGAPMGISVDSLISIWKNANQTGNAAVETTIGNSSAANYMTHYAYQNSNGESTVELFKIHNGVHAWYNYNTTGNGFDIAHESWMFFNRFQQNGTASISDKDFSNQFEIYPNPVKDVLHLKGDLMTIQNVQVVTLSGGIVLNFSNAKEKLDLSTLSSGVYILKIQAKNGQNFQYKFVK